jgi:hypothetical protein
MQSGDNASAGPEILLASGSDWEMIPGRKKYQPSLKEAGLFIDSKKVISLSHGTTTDTIGSNGLPFLNSDPIT